MESHSSSPRRTYDSPKPDTGLAEWTSKIKAMQRQVDADEEAEQKRLEDEIAASRLARLRRSHAAGDSNENSDWSTSSPNSFPDIGATAPHNAMSVTERHTNQRSILRTPRANVTHFEGAGDTSIRSSIDTKPPPISLAAFMGGHATGPRLNRHAPQQDTHDPTRFHQRKDDYVPHPIFGKGGVAMPGMAVRGNESNADRPSNIVTPESSVRKAELPSNSKRGRAPALRERPTSTSALPSSSPPVHVKPDLAPSRSNADLKKAPQDQNVDIRALSTAAAVKLVQRPVTPHREHEGSFKASPKSSITTPTLARPIYPQPRLSTSRPQIPVSDVPSPAFLRTPPQKDPTPSISRLQGRGFVQSIVKVSKELECSPTSDAGIEHSRQAGGRRASVLDRWQTNLPGPSPPVSPTPKSVRRSVTIDPASAASDRQRVPITASPKKLKSARSSSSFRSTDANDFPSADPASDLAVEENMSPKGLGSATTLLVYKPTPLSSPVVDEFGLKNGVVPKSGYQAGRLPASSGKPLSHPTRDRARKPPKFSRQESTMHPRTLTSDIEPPTSVDSSQTLVELSESSTIPFSSMTADDANKVGSQVANMTNVDPKLAWSASVSEQPLNRMVRRALPGMMAHQQARTTAELAGEPFQARNSVSNEESNTSNAVLSQDRPMPSRDSRIPNTGNRATVMDVVQVLSAQSSDPESASESQPQPSIPLAGNQPRNLIPPSVHGEKRKSSQEKYSAIMLPSLKEEITPTASPVATLSHARTYIHQQKPVDEVLGNSGILGELNHSDDGDVLLPWVNIEPLIKPPAPPLANMKPETISVDILHVTSTAATTIPLSQVIFYDTELLVIVHRSKSRTTGLVSTTLWVWRGKRCTLGEKENRKLQELAKRYGTPATIVQQHSEPAQLVHVLGGQLAIRQGMRAHWTHENTTMHLVRSKDGVIFIDEHDLSIQYLCSGFSYCLSVLGVVYVWYGCGSTARERQAALQYARSLEMGGNPAVELYEGRKENDEMFWMILGDEEFANADHWKWRHTSSLIDPRIWRVNASTDKDALIQVDSFAAESCFHTSVYIIDCVWELYVMVGSDARGHRHDIRLALRIALDLSTRVASARPYAPTVHTIILPSQLPRDLRLNFRDLDELSINSGNIPDHMNILSSTDALDHLQKSSWNKFALQDQTMLPLGIGP